MAEITQILELLDDVLTQIELIKGQVEALRKAGATRSRVRTGTRPLGPDNVIQPTQTDEPDSIVGGKLVRRGEFPDCCAVGDEYEFYCSGTLIAPNVVVTAGHCDYATRVFLNGNDVDHPDANAEFIDIKTITDAKGFKRLADYRHPNPRVDLRVLVLERDSIVPPRRIAEESDLEGLEEVMLVGFGMTNLEGTMGYGAKRQVVVPVESFDCTDTEVADRRGCREDYEIVAGHRGLLRDSCKGDSGGPLYVEAEDGSYLLLGATARGAWGKDNECGDGGIYVRVDKFLDWIREVTGVEI